MKTNMENFDIKKYLDWKIAICYHPMFMLVDEDRGEPTIGERIPPWGYPTVDEYLKRCERNMAAIEENPDAYINYEWAVCAIENIANRFPEVFARMKKLYDDGRLDFVGGDYALVHSNGQSSEATYKEFEIGQKVFRQLFGDRGIKVFAHQETHIFEQLPALLKKFGIEYAIAPSFPWALRMKHVNDFELMGHESGTYIKNDNAFIGMKSLGGEVVPLYIPTNVRQTNAYAEIQKDMWNCPKLWVDFPDLEEYHNPQPFAEPAILQDWLREHFEGYSAEAIIHTYFSYVEGIWAEEHLRAARRAEEKLVLCEFVYNFTRKCGLHDKTVDLTEMWKTVMRYEDHDATWIEVTDLRRKAINHFNDVSAACDRLIDQVLTTCEDKKSVLNVLPVARKSILKTTEDKAPCGVKLQRCGDYVYGVLAAEPVSVRTLTGDREICGSRPVDPLTTYTNPYYTVEFADNGLIKQVTLASGKKVLSEASGYLCGEVRGVKDLTWVEEELEPNDLELGNPIVSDEQKAREARNTIRTLAGGKWITNREAKVSFFTGDVFTAVVRTGEMDGIPFTERYFFFHDYPEIKTELSYDFNGDSIGDMHIEKTKLNVYVPTLGEEIHNDVPYGIIRSHNKESLYATNWVTTGNVGLINRGTVKNFVEDRTMAMTFGWGAKHWTNRIHFDFWMSKCETYDLRLYGHQEVEYYLTFMDSYSERHMTDAVNNITIPVTVINGSADRENVYALKDADRLAITALAADEDGRYRIRGYQLNENDEDDRPIIETNLD